MLQGIISDLVVMVPIGSAKHLGFQGWALCSILLRDMMLAKDSNGCALNLMIYSYNCYQNCTNNNCQLLIII